MVYPLMVLERPPYIDVIAVVVSADKNFVTVTTPKINLTKVCGGGTFIVAVPGCRCRRRRTAEVCRRRAARSRDMRLRTTCNDLAVSDDTWCLVAHDD